MMDDHVTTAAHGVCELGHPVAVQRVDGVLETHMHRDTIEVNTETGEEAVTYCPKCQDAARDLIVAHNLGSDSPIS